jgi:hypothetical protein
LRLSGSESIMSSSCCLGRLEGQWGLEASWGALELQLPHAVCNSLEAESLVS